ncbi:tRNA-specific adenosine deaminase [Pedobacter psychrophilus]|uniref:tRNA-specific adenosine deaminase n=2 Tax=Pedobacter psychrophilus TaxID=1826909 RepID=A0A179DIN9_9SPHI|nr:tRNA-specific adenosine deaminase [Pedobacter psychrophilus]
MRLAIALSHQNVEQDLGGPFGAVIVKDGKIIAQSANTVTTTNDPTAHAEVATIRLACANLNTFNLEGCVIYTSCEPCPMCLGAIYWGRLDKMYYGNTKKDAANIGFDDAFIYQELDLTPENRKLKSEQILADEAIKAFNLWEKSEKRIDY